MLGDQGTDSFQALVARIEYPMFVVTAAAGGDRAGCLVGFSTQCSIDPVRFLVCISKRNRTMRVAARAETLIIHFLTGDDVQTAKLFGENTGDEVDKFARCRWKPGPGGAPVLTGSRGWVAGRILDRLDLGDHVGCLLEPFAGEATGEDRGQLGFQSVRHLQPGHEA